MRRRIYILLSMLLLTLSLPPIAHAAEDDQRSAVVWVIDASGSMENYDKSKYFADAVSLGIDLAPKHSQSAVLAVTDIVTAQTPLMDIDSEANRQTIRTAAEGIQYKGNTNFAAGIERALELLTDPAISDKSIVLIADIGEGGFYRQNVKDYSDEIEHLKMLTQQASASGVTVHMLLLNTAPDTNDFITYWENLAAQTGGEITYVSDSSALPQAVENMYFSKYTYLKSVTTGINTTDYVQPLTIHLPQIPMRSARLYIHAPLAGIQASGDGSGLSVNQVRSYTMINLAPPFPESIELSLPPSQNQSIQIYLLADCDLSIVAAVASVPESDNAEPLEVYHQKSTVTVNATASGSALFSGAPPEGLEYRITMTDPNGNRVDIEPTGAKDGAFTYEFLPALFGQYTFMVSVASHGIELSASTTAEIPEIELPIVEPPEPPDYTLWYAIGGGVLILLLAITLAFLLRRRREVRVVNLPKEEEIQVGEVEIGTFAGKLDIYGIMVDGGKTEIPATTFKLSQINGKRWIRLSTVMETSGVPYHYKAADEIRLMPGPDSTLIVNNHSDAVIFSSGQTYRKGQQVKLLFGQKIYVVFEQDVNEFEVYFHSVAEAKSPSSRFTMEMT